MMYRNIQGTVTILILIDGFLQFDDMKYSRARAKRHNPYFNRWFSAMISVIYMISLVTPSQSLF